MTGAPSKPVSALRVAVVLILFITAQSGGNLLLAWGMKHLGPASLSPYLAAALNPFVGAGVVALILAVLARMALLSLADLSFVLPVTAIGYVIATFLGVTFLHETVSGQHWLGTLLIFLGAALVGSTAHSTTGPMLAPQEAIETAEYARATAAGRGVRPLESQAE